MNISRLIITAVVLAFMAGPTFADKNKKYICHKGKTIRVDKNAVKSHINHGDTKGKCTTISAVIMMRCKNNAGMLQVSGWSSSYNEAHIQPILEDKLSCAEEVARAINEGFKLHKVHTGLTEGETEYIFVKNVLKPENY